ncbi:MAG: type VI secretion system baseplate subunit TssF [Holosporaceae bacterium]|nr:MAG: type VI secretion system baseplate subunit TssF [Holosporaceae bacterium]
MAKPTDNDLLYYQREISFLRHMGKAFSQKYPKIARRLNFLESHQSDPHLERLIESFAFLTAHLQKDIDNQLPRFSSALLSILYPHLVRPIPPLSIAQFKAPKSKPMTESYKVPRHTSLYAAPKSSDVCNFRTGYDTEIWPIEVKDVALIKSESVDFYLSPHAHMMEITLKAIKTPFSKLDINRLRFYINGTTVEQNTLYRLLFEEKLEIAVQTDPKKAPKIIKKESIQPVGFDEGDSLIPCPDNAHPAYGLLQEYFSFSRKFMFFDLINLDLKAADTEVKIFIPMINSKSAQSITFSAARLALGCTPIVNLFEKTTEPLRFDHQKIDYRLVPDYRREMTTEIHSVEKVYMSAVNETETREIQPYFSYSHQTTHDQETVFWSARRTQTTNPNIPGTDLWLNFVNWNLKPDLPSAEVVYAKTLCTNRQLASLMTDQTRLTSNDPIPADDILCLHQPTPQIYPSEDGQTQWQLISSLAVNYTSCSSGPESLAALKEILRLFNPTLEKTKSLEVDRLVQMEAEPVVRRLGKDIWRGFTKGTKITLTFDEDDALGSTGIFLFSHVLSHFFGLYTQINSFIELTVKNKGKERILKAWPPRTGTKRLI